MGRIVPEVGEIATMEVGEGPPVLLLHGLNGFKESWGRLPEALADAGMRAVAVDMPGFGESPRLSRATPARMAAAVAPLLERLGPAAVVGHSLGTQVATILAVRHPERVRRMALLAPWVLGRPRRFPPRGPADVLQLPLVGRPLGRVVIALMRPSPRRRVEAFAATIADPDAVVRDPVAAAVLVAAADRLETVDLRAMTDWAASSLRFDVRPLAGRVRAPVLVVGGALDRVARPAGAQWLAGAVPGARLLRLEGVGHMPHIEAPRAVGPAVAEHLR